MSDRFGSVLGAVKMRQAEMSQYVFDAMNDYAGAALDAIQELKNVGDPSATAGPAPVFSDPALPNVASPVLASKPNSPNAAEISDPSAGLAITGDVSDSVKTALDAIAIPNVPMPTLPAAPTINFPQAPALSAITDPGNAPAMDDVAIPNAPTLAMPAIPTLADIVVPDFTFPTLPLFDATAPDYAAPMDYQLSVDAHGQATVIYDGRTMYKGGRYDLLGADGKALFGAVYADMQQIISVRGTGIAPAVEQAMFDSAKAREDEITHAAVQGVTNRWASRGFALPGGILDAQINQVTQENQLKSRSLSRDVMLKRADQELDMLKFVMGQAVAAEQFMFSVYESTSKQQLDVLQTVTSVNAGLVESSVKVFNAQSSLVQLEADIWKTRIDSEMKKIDVYRAQLDAAQAKGQLNEQKVRTYVAMYEGAKAEVGLYTAKMEGVKTQLQAQQSKIDGYRATVQAYSERQQAERSKMQTYTDQVNAERSKIEIYDSQAKVYLGQLDAVLRTGDMGIKKAEAFSSAKGQDVQAFEAKLRANTANTAKMQAEVAELEASSRQYLAELEAISKGNDTELGRFRAELDNKTQTLRSAVDIFGAKTQAYSTQLNALSDAAKTSIGAATAAGELGAKVAMGALSAFNVSAGMSVSAETKDDKAPVTTGTK